MDFKDLLAYKKAFELAMRTFEVTKTYPKEEVYALVSQIRRSSRAVPANIAEGYRKRRYINHFVSKLTDADAENSETQVWIAFSLKCGYINEADHQALTEQSLEIGRLIGYMIQHPHQFGVPKD